MTDDELFSSCNENEAESEQFNDILTEDERRQPENALKLDSSEFSNENGDGIIEHQHSVDEKVSDLLGDSLSRNQSRPGRSNVDIIVKGDDHRRGRDMNASSSTSSDNRNHHKGASKENEYTKGLRPILWLSPNFPLQTEELLLLLDILANKVKAIRCLRELLTTKLPMGTFPVKVAIPVVCTIRVIFTFTKLEELAPMDEIATLPSSPLEGRARVRCNRQVHLGFSG